MGARKRKTPVFASVDRNMMIRRYFINMVNSTRCRAANTYGSNMKVILAVRALNGESDGTLDSKIACWEHSKTIMEREKPNISVFDSAKLLASNTFVEKSHFAMVQMLPCISQPLWSLT